MIGRRPNLLKHFDSTIINVTNNTPTIVYSLPTTLPIELSTQANDSNSVIFPPPLTSYKIPVKNYQEIAPVENCQEIAPVENCQEMDPPEENQVLPSPLEYNQRIFICKVYDAFEKNFNQVNI